MTLAVLAAVLLASQSPAAPQAAEDQIRFHVTFAGEEAHDAALLDKSAAIFRQRLDERSKAVTIKTRPEKGSLIVAVPFASAVDPLPARTLRSRIDAASNSLELDGEEPVPAPGLLRIDEEWLHYSVAAGPWACRVERGVWKSKTDAHAAGSRVEVFSCEELELLLHARGELAFMEGASPEYLESHQTTLEAERERLRAWGREKPGGRLNEFDNLSRDKGGPLPGLIWRGEMDPGESCEHTVDYRLLIRPTDPRTCFTRADCRDFELDTSSAGEPGISFSLREERAEAFSDWTEAIQGHYLAVVFDREVLTFARVTARLPAKGSLLTRPTDTLGRKGRPILRVLQAEPLPLPEESCTWSLVHPK